MKASIIILLFFFIFLSVSLSFSQSRKIDIPTNRNNDTTYYYKNHYKKITGLGLVNLYNECDSINFRLWTDRNLLDFKIDREGKLNCDYYTFLLSGYGKEKSVGCKYNKYIIEKNETAFLWQLIDSLGIIDMPDESKIPIKPKYVIINGDSCIVAYAVLDGYICVTELSTDLIYKFCTYNNPDVSPESSKESNSIAKFIEIAEKRLKMKNRNALLFIDKPDDGFKSIKELNKLKTK